MPDEARKVIVSVDTHADSHTAIDGLRRRLDTIEIQATVSGYRCLLEWAGRLGELSCFGVEGTGSYGAGLSRVLSDSGVRVVEVRAGEPSTPPPLR